MAPAPTTPTQPKLTAETVLRDPPDLPRWELIDGEVIALSPVGFHHNDIAARIYDALRDYVRENGGRKRAGHAVINDTGFRVKHDPDSVRAPDAAFIAADRDTPGEPGFFDGPPDFAAEVVSPKDRPEEVDDKANMWLDAGTRLVWVVWPPTRSVSVYTPGGGSPAILHEGDTLDGKGVMPGFTLDVRTLFEL